MQRSGNRSLFAKEERAGDTEDVVDHTVSFGFWPKNNRKLLNEANLRHKLIKYVFFKRSLSRSSSSKAECVYQTNPTAYSNNKSEQPLYLLKKFSK